MPGKSHSAKKSAKRSKSSSTKKDGDSKKRSKSASAVDKPGVCTDILSPAAMLNAYYICHDAVDCLEKRGFKWEGAKKKKKKKK